MLYFRASRESLRLKREFRFGQACCGVPLFLRAWRSVADDGSIIAHRRMSLERIMSIYWRRRPPIADGVAVALIIMVCAIVERSYGEFIAIFIGAGLCLVMMQLDQRFSGPSQI